MYLRLQEPRNKKTAVEEQLVQEVERLKAKVEAGKACFLEKYRVSTAPQTDQATQGCRTGRWQRWGAQEAKGVKVCGSWTKPRGLCTLVKENTPSAKKRDGVWGQKPAWRSPKIEAPAQPWVSGKVFITTEQTDWQFLYRLSALLLPPFEDVKQDQKSQQEPVGMRSQEPAVSTVVG